MERKTAKKQSKALKFVKIILIIALFPIILIYVAAKFVQWKKLQRRAQSQIDFYNLSQLATLGGAEFESTLAGLFELMGYAVIATAKTGDFGADLIVEKKGRKTLIQAKRYSGVVGVKAVQEVIAAREHYKVSECMVVTNSTFSTEAKVLAEESGTRLVDGTMLETLLKRYGAKIVKSESRYVALTPEAVREINAKYRFWI